MFSGRSCALPAPNENFSLSMKLHLNLSLRRAVLAALAALSSLSYTASAGVVDSRYDVQYYLDFSYNKGMFAAGSTNLAVFYKDGSAISNNVIPLMPNLDSYVRVGRVTTLPMTGTILEADGGAGLIGSQFTFGAAHVFRKTPDAETAFFLTENGSWTTAYAEANQNLFGADSGIQRLTKLVTEVAYTPMADDAFMRTMTTNGTWLYRLGNGGTWNTNGEAVSTNSNALGGIINATSIADKNGNGDWSLEGWHRKGDGPRDTRTPLDMGVYFGDSGSPIYAWDAENNRFLTVGSMFASNVAVSYDNYFLAQFYPTKAQEYIDSYTVAANQFSGTETILWGTQDAVTGKGTLQQGEISLEYTGLGSGNTPGDSLGLTFDTQDTANVQTLALQGSVNMGAGAMTFNSGSWKLTEADTAYTFNSAGFEVNKGAELTLELTAGAGEEWRKVGEGTMTIAGSGNNEAVLRVGGGTTQYNVSYDESGNIIGCTLGNVGETRLNRTGGYAASSVRLEGGVAILVLMQGGQFKTNSVAGDTFSFGNAGGLLNLNGHDLEWGVINQVGSEKGARIGNFTPLGEQAPGLATFTYTGTGSFDGCFMDEGRDSTAQLAVKYNNAAGGTWTLTGNNSNAGGFTVEAGTMKLQGINTPHVGMTDSADWTYASIVGSDVTVKSGATFQLSHHALMQGNVTVESGGSFVLNQTVNAASESISGGLRQDMNGTDGSGVFQSLVGNVTLNGAATMVVATDSPVATTMRGSIINNYNVQIPLPGNPNMTRPGQEFASFTKQGSGVFVIDGQLQVPLGTVEEGGLVVTDATNFVSSYTKWKINEKGFLAVQGLTGQEAVNCIHMDSTGVLALTSTQETALDLSLRPNLIIGAWGDVSYGTQDAELSAIDNVWRLGGGTGTLTVNFKLTGASDLIIGNQWSSGTVHLANTGNDFSGTILIQGFGNVLTYADGALGSARVSLPYGNAMALKSASQLGMIAANSGGVLALETSENLDLSGTKFSLGAVGEQTYRGELTVDDTYRFGGTGHLTLDTTLDKASAMELDGQGMSGSSVTFAREKAFAGTIKAGGGLQLQTPNSMGSIDIHVGHEKSLAAAAAVELQKGAVLYTGGNNIEVRNLTLQSGSALRNNGESDSRVTLHVSENTATSFADGVLTSTVGTPNIHIVKTGSGTLTMETNATWTGGLTISEGTVCGTISASSGTLSSGGIGADSNVIYVEENGILRMTGVRRTGRSLGGTAIVQQVLGTGTIELSTGGAALFSTQTTSFEGTLRLLDNTRLYLGSSLNYNGQASYNSLNSLQKATVEVTEGSQVRITSGLYYQANVSQSVNSNFIIRGDGYQGATGNDPTNTTISLKQESLNRGALSIDFASTVYGNITLAEDATIASWSNNPDNTNQCTVSYGYKGTLGGTVRGRILGEGKTLTIAGNESMTFTADSANTYGNLVIANGNGNNDDKFALQLNGGKAISQVSTALGTGDVTLNAGLILRLAGTGAANNTDIVYTYANDITAGEGATIQSHNITNRLTGTVSMNGSVLNLATADGGVLELAGQLVGSGSLNAAAGADISLASSSVLGNSISIIGTDALTLRLGGTGDYTLGGISGASALTLHFDFTNTPTVGDDATWSTLSSSIAAGTTTIALDLNLFNDIEKGNYTLISSAGEGMFYQLADDMNGRLHLVTNDAGALVLTVDADNRLFWRTDGPSGNWNSTDANWYSDAAAGSTTFSSDANVMLDKSGVAGGNSASSRETIGLNESLTVGTLGVQDAAYELSGSGSLSGKSLTVGNGGDLKLSNTGGNTFSEGVVVNNAALTVEGNTLTAEVRAEDGGSVTLQGSAVLNGNLDVSDAETVIRESTVQGKVSLSGTGRMQMDAAQINGSVVSDGGTLNLNSAKLSGNLSNGESSLNSTALTILSGSVTSDAMLRMDSLRLQDGSLQINAAANIGVLGIAAGKTVTLWNATAAAGADKIIGTLELANGAVLQSNDREAVTAANQIGTVKLTGASATLRDAYHSGFFEIHNLEGAADSTLNLVKNVTSNNVGVFALGHSSATTESGSRFAGTILVKQQNASTDSNRDVVLLLNHESVAQEATINLASAAQATPKVALGINVDAATIGGLRSGQTLENRAVVFSGMQASDKGWTDPSQNPAHTLTIDTKVGSVHEFYGQVQNVNLVIDGEGTQKFLGSGDQFTGSLSIQGGTAVFNAASFSMLNNASSLVVGSGTLDVSAIDFTDSVNVIRVDNGRSISFAENSTVAFGAMEAGREYSVFDISGGVLEGWSDLSASNFTIDGVKLSDLGRVALNFGMIGAFSYTIEDGWDLVWKGGAEKQTWNQNESNHVWQTTRPDDITGDSVTTDIGYVNNDNVVFNSDADLVLEGNIRVNDMTVAEGVSLKTHGNLVITGALDVGSGVSWSFSGDTSLSFTETQLKSFAAMEVGEGATLSVNGFGNTRNTTSDALDKVSGSGKVVLDYNVLATDNGIGFDFSGLTGKVQVDSGRVLLSSSTFGETHPDFVLMSSNSQLVFSSKTGTELKGNVVLGATTTIHVNSGSPQNCSGTISGVISGSGGLTKAGAGSLTFKSQNTYTGVTTISGGKIILDTAGDYCLKNNISGGTLEVAKGTTLVNDGNELSSALVLTQGAAAKVSGSRKLKENITVNSGATLTFIGSGSDTLEYGNAAQYSKKLTVDEGVVDFGNTRQTMAKWEITLKNGASLRGDGGSYQYSGKTAYAAMDFNQDVVIKAESGDNTISATTRLRDGNSRTLTYNVGEGATLDVSGRIFGDNDTTPAGNITKSGAGKATLSARTRLNKVTTSGGEIAVAYTGNDGNTIGTLDGSGEGTAAGSLRLKKDAQLNVSTALKGRSQSSVVLEQGAALTHGDVEFSNKGTTDATLKTSSNNSQYEVGAADWSLTKGHLTATSSGGVTLGTQLVNSSVENAGSGLLTVSNAANSITSVYASAGDMRILQQGDGLNLLELAVASQKTVSAYSGMNATATEEANVTVSGHAAFGTDAVLNANLTLAAGATLEVGVGGLTMGSTLTLLEGLTLGNDTLSRVRELSVGESLTLFCGVDGLTLGETGYTTITTEECILANSYFTNLGAGSYAFTYSGTENGSLSITMMSAAVPEPTSSMLSLMGLVAFTFRRRRK